MSYKKSKYPNNFLGLAAKYGDFDRSSFVVYPIPYELTTSYKQGTKNGPKAIIEASKYLEDFDEELGIEPFKAGVHTFKPLKLSGKNEQNVQDKIRKSVAATIRSNKIPILLGGEHSITPPAVAACSEKFKKLSVLQMDAHADLRDSYEGTKYSHACAMRRILEICPAVQVGIRNISREEYEFAKNNGQLDKIYFHNKLKWDEVVKNVVRQLSDEVYITIDVDGLDPSIMPATGTPEPGGIYWQEIIALLKAVAENKKVVGFDVVELLPQKGFHSCDFICAKLIYKLMGYIVSKK